MENKDLDNFTSGDFWKKLFSPGPDPAPAPSHFVIEDGVLKKYKGPGGDVVILEGVWQIGQTAFYEQKRVTSVQFPKSLRAINHEAFAYCTALTEIMLPEKLWRKSLCRRALNTSEPALSSPARPWRKSRCRRACKAWMSTHSEPVRPSAGWWSLGTCPPSRPALSSWTASRGPASLTGRETS